MVHTRTSGSTRHGEPLDAVLDEVRQVCADVRQRLSVTSSAGVMLADIERMIDEPLRMAVVGRPTRGRSTLVNAILGRRITDGWWPELRGDPHAAHRESSLRVRRQAVHDFTTGRY
jgi:hypothetical protein